MTSKISFFKLCKENLQRFTAATMITLFYFLFTILAFVISLQNELSRDNTNMLLTINSLSEPDFGSAFFIMILAALLAFSGFRFLHSRTQTDFYASLPMKRSTMFRVVAVNSFLIFTIPLLISTVMKFLILTSVGFANMTALYNLLWSVLCSLASFLAVWVTCVLAITMTGHTIVALLGFGVFGSYFPVVLRYLIPCYAETFFKNYASNATLSQKFLYGSPATLIYKLTTDYTIWTFAEHYKYFWMLIAWIIVIGLIAYILYLKRPSEAAGRAMAFEKANPVIRFLLVIPLTLYTGIFFYTLALNSMIIWLFVGILLGAFIFHSIVECIYQFDIRGMFSHRKQLVASMIICFVFTGLFMTDAFGYDNYIPKEDELNSIVISFDSYYTDSTYNLGYEKDGVTGENIATALKLIQDISDQNLSSDNDDAYGLTVTYHLKNGNTTSRSYIMDPTAETALLDEIAATEDFKNDFYSLYTVDRNFIKSLVWNGCTETVNLSLSDEVQNELFDTYLEELSALTFTQMTEESPVCELQITYDNGTSEYYDIYPSFTKTIALLQEQNLPAAAKLRDVCDITNLDVTTYDADYDISATTRITDPDLIDSLMDDLVIAAFANNSMSSYDNYYELTATMTRDGRTSTATMYITKEGSKKLQAALDGN